MGTLSLFSFIFFYQRIEDVHKEVSKNITVVLEVIFLMWDTSPFKSLVGLAAYYKTKQTWSSKKKSSTFKSIWCSVMLSDYNINKSDNFTYLVGQRQVAKCYSSSEQFYLVYQGILMNRLMSN